MKTQTITQILIGLTILVIAIFLVPSVFQKGGVDQIVFIEIGGIILFSSILILSKREFKKDLIIVFIIVPIIILLGLIIQYLAIQLIYGDKTWFLWELKGRIISNCFLYGIAGIAILITRNKMLRKV